MKRKLCILEVEDVNKRTLFNFHEHLLNWLNLKNPIILVLLWTTNDEEKNKKYKKIIEDYFRDLGVKEILFLEENDPILEEKFDKANIIYLPEGDTDILLERLNKNPKVIEKLNKFNGIVIGNSAGAIALTKEGYGHKEGKLVKYKGLGVVNVKILVHVKQKDLEKLKEKNVILLDEGDYVVVNR